VSYSKSLSAGSVGGGSRWRQPSTNSSIDGVVAALVDVRWASTMWSRSTLGRTLRSQGPPSIEPLWSGGTCSRQSCRKSSPSVWVGKIS
jgi:hypothetical protein